MRRIVLSFGLIIFMLMSQHMVAQSLIGSTIVGESPNDFAVKMALSANGERMVIGGEGNDDGGNNAGHVRVYEWNGTAWTQMGSDIDGTGVNDSFGYDVSMSSSGDRIAVAGPYSSVAAYIRVYEWNGTDWVQLGTDINEEASADNLSAVGISGDGNRLIAGASFNDGNGTSAGHARIFEYNGTDWVQLGADIDGQAAGDRAGEGVSISSDGSIVAVGAPYNDNGGLFAGSVRVFQYDGSSWVQLGNDINATTAASDFFAAGEKAVSLSGSGMRLAYGCYTNDNATGVDAGTVRVYEYNGTDWIQLGTDILGEAAGDFFGIGVRLSSSGNVVVGTASGNNGGGANAGHARVFRYNGSDWVQFGQNIEGAAGDQMLYASSSANGDIVAVGRRSSNVAGEVDVYQLPSVLVCDSLTFCSIDNLGDVDLTGISTGDVLMWNGSGFTAGTISQAAQIWNSNGNDIYYDAGYVGLGTSTPSAQLEISNPNLGSDPAVSISGTDALAPDGYSLLIQGHPSGAVTTEHVQLTTGKAASRMTLKCADVADFAPRLQVIGPDDPGSAGWAVFDYGSYLQNLTSAAFKMRHMSPSGPIDMLHADGRNGLYLAPNQGNVGIGTNAPDAKLEVTNGAVLFSGTTGSTPISGTGSRMMWTPDKSAFRAGFVNGGQWDAANIGDYSAAFGHSTEATGTASTAMGISTQSSYGALAIGRYNDDGGSNSAWNGTDYVFTIGDGTGIGNRSNAMYVQKNGNAWIQGTLSQSSDARLKKDITQIENAMASIEQINGVRYLWKNEEQMGNDIQIGFIAQELEEVYPELVTEVEGHKAVNYIGLIPVLLEAMKEQNEVIADLRAELDALKGETVPASNTKAVPSTNGEGASLFQNQPNPFHIETELPYFLPEGVEDAFILVQEIATGKSIGYYPITETGNGKVRFQTDSLPAGVYLYSLYVENEKVDSKRMVLMN